MWNLDIFIFFKIGNGSGDFDDTMIGAGGKLQLIDRAAEKIQFFFSKLAKFFHLLVGHFRVGDDSIDIFETLVLAFTGGDHPFPNRRA